MHLFTISMFIKIQNQEAKCRSDNSNVEADRLAGEYQDEFGAYSPTTHMYSSSPAVLEIDGMTITSNVRHHLIKAYAEPRYMQYLQKQNKWNQQTVQEI